MLYKLSCHAIFVIIATCKLCNAMLCNAMQCYAIQCNAMLCYAIQCYARPCCFSHSVRYSPSPPCSRSASCVPTCTILPWSITKMRSAL